MKIQFPFFIKQATFSSLILSIFFLLLNTTVSAQTSVVQWPSNGTGVPETITGTFTGGTVTVTHAGSGHNINLANNGTNRLWTNAGTGAMGQSKSLVFTFSTPVLINQLRVEDVNQSTTWNDVANFSISFNTFSGSSSAVSVNNSGFASGAGSAQTVWFNTSTTTVTTFTINFPSTGTLNHATLYWYFNVTVVCAAGTEAPQF